MYRQHHILARLITLALFPALLPSFAPPPKDRGINLRTTGRRKPSPKKRKKKA